MSVCSEWKDLSNGEKAVFCAFNAQIINNIPQIPGENSEVIPSIYYTPSNDIIDDFMNEDGSMREFIDENKFTQEQVDAVILWLTEYVYEESEYCDDVDYEEITWDEGYSSDNGWGDMDEDW